MKSRSRLTALLLALMLLLSLSPTAALADAIQTVEDYQSAVQRVKDEMSKPSVPQEQENSFVLTRTAQVQSIVRGENAGTVEQAGSYALPLTGRLTLTAPAADGYQWQIKVGDVWANIVEDNGPSITLTYAKVQTALTANAVQVRCVLLNGGQLTASAEVTVTVDSTVTTETKNVEQTIPVTSFYGDAVKNPVQALNAPVLAETGQPTTYTILIQYQFEDGSQAAPPWSATVAAGSTYTQDVQSPVVVGYAPSEEVVHVDASEEKTYTVSYSPAEVEFTVKHYKQNVSNDQYTLADTETRKGFTENPVGDALAQTYEGFTALLYDATTRIAADGSTEVEIRYDRKYYLMNFVLDGGYGVEPIYARYGAPVSIGTPTRPGYTFTGWDKELPTTMPAENSKYTAQWKAGDAAKVTIVVWGENPDDENYSFYKNAEIMAKPGEKLTLDDLQGKLVCGKEEHTHSSACGINCGHVHTLACYGLNNASSTSPNSNTAWWCDSKPETYFEQLGLEDGYLYYDDENAALDSKDNYYLRFDGKYYKLKQSQFNKLRGTEIGKTSDNARYNPDYYYKYSINPNGIACTHTHTDACYACGKEEHTHTSACHYNNSFMENPELWKLVRPDEVTVAADGTTIMNVYYDRVEFTLHFRKANSNSDNYGTIKAKWGANIRDQFNAKSTQAGTSNWSENRDASSPWTSYLDIMPTLDRTYYAYKGSGTSTAYYYVEGLDGEDELFYTSVASGTGLYVSEEEFIKINGFTFNANRSTKENEDFDGAKFYYTRNSYNLSFYNYNAEVSGKGGSVKYEAPLKAYYFEPDYPSGLEPNAYVFAGWYTTAGCYEGSEADLNTMTMPAADVVLYAKWVPKTHTVKTWLTDKMDTPVNVGVTGSNEQTVKHGEQAVKPADPENGNYTFVGWFYIENGTEKAFDFSMPVNRDLNLYAKWSSNNLVAYTIRYQLENGTEIATPTTGSALAGTTKTFDAKTGTALNEGYQSGYFPKTASHSLTMNIEGGNEFTFVYVKKDEVNYTVRYLEKDTEKQLVEPKTVSTRDAVITEKFVQVTGYAPDAYQKRLVLIADEKQNVITFWYVKDEVHAPVQIIHWTQNIAGDEYTEYQSSTNLNGEIKKEQTSTALTINGFEYKRGTAVAGSTSTEFPAPATPKATLTAEGLVLNLYYDRIEYPYAFRFVEQGTDKKLADDETGKARYEAQVTQTAKTIPGYKLVAGTSENQAITIAIEDPAETASKNVKTFYYVEDIVDIKYQVVGPTGSGTLDNYQDNGIGVLTGKITGTEGLLKGSAPTVAENFKFVGWFKDEACTQHVDTSWVAADNKLTPDKTKNYGTVENPVMGYEAAIYYAKFEYDLTTLTIKKEGMADIDDGQSFLFRVKGHGLPEAGLVIAIHGNGSKTISGLTVGQEYTVTEISTWSWRYSADEQTITLQATDNNVTMVNSRHKTQWLDGDSYAENVFGN